MNDCSIFLVTKFRINRISLLLSLCLCYVDGFAFQQMSYLSVLTYRFEIVRIFQNKFSLILSEVELLYYSLLLLHSLCTEVFFDFHRLS